MQRRNFQTSVTLTLTLDMVIRHTVLYHSSITKQRLLKSEKLSVGGRMYGRPSVHRKPPT